MNELLTLKGSLFLKDDIVLLETGQENYLWTVELILKDLVNHRKMPLIYVTINRPYESLRALFLKKKIDLRLMMFIEAIPGKKTKGLNPSTSNCLSLGGPYNLTDISLAISEALSAISQENKVVIIDSLDAFLHYGSTTTILRFMHFILSKIREFGAKGVILTMKNNQHEGVISDLSGLCQYVSAETLEHGQKWLS